MLRIARPLQKLAQSTIRSAAARSRARLRARESLRPALRGQFAGDMSFFAVVTNKSIITDEVRAQPSYCVNSVAYVLLYFLALAPNLLLFYMSCKRRLVTSRIKLPILLLTTANILGILGYLSVNIVYLWALITNVRKPGGRRSLARLAAKRRRFQTAISLTAASLLRTLLFNLTYVNYFVIPLLAVDNWLFVCRNYRLRTRSLSYFFAVCCVLPLLIAVYDLCLQETVQAS